MEAHLRCQKCGHEWREKPGPTQCPECGHLYIDWLNFEEMRKVWDEKDLAERGRI